MFKALVAVACVFSAVPKWCPLRWVLSLVNRKKSHGTKSGLYGGWGSVMILFWAKNSHTSDKFFGTIFAQILLVCGSSVMIWWTSVFGSPLRLTAHSNVGPYPEQPSHEPQCSQFLQLKDALRTVLPQRSPFRPWTPCATWTQNSIPTSCPQQLQRFGTRFSEFRAELNRVTLLQTPLYFRPWQDTKTTTHFANVPTATKARTQPRKVKLYTWVPSPPASTTTFLSWPFCAA